MQTNLADFIQHTRDGEEAGQILRKCVHCGFCTATCPTYQLFGDELDGPRGRIYLIKQVLEGKPATAATQLHLDRCLTCRNCESTCPSGVQYGRLLDIGRKVVAQQVQRPFWQRVQRKVLQTGLPKKWLFTPLLRMGQNMQDMLPQSLAAKVPQTQLAGAWPQTKHARKMLVLSGCVQPALAPDINAAAARVLDALGVQLLPDHGGCCGALAHHLDQHEAALQQIRRNIDAWWPQVEAGVEAIVMTASGCGVMVKDYGHALADDPAYAHKAQRIAALTRDLSEILPAFENELRALCKPAGAEKITFHPPCTLQHGQQIRGKVEGLLRALGVEVRLCADSHLCCGSAGTYSILQPEISGQLRANKLKNLLATSPDKIVTANIGCQTHLQGGTSVPVRHWVELLDQLLQTES
jgi:glycolate oxidase iron-sulfur subunit